jgi:hypothetical protein
MRLLTPTTIEAKDVHPALPGYLASMTGHCPFLGPSLSRNATTWCSYEADVDDGPELLGALTEAAEEVRVQRREAGILACANIAIFGPNDIASARAVLDWPHWMARKLYAPVALMVGKFWIGEQEDDRNGHPIAPPPVSFFSIRHSFPAKDARFLSNLPGVAEQLASSDEDERDVLMPWLGVPLTPQAVRARYVDLLAVFPAEQKVTT